MVAEQQGDAGCAAAAGSDKDGVPQGQVKQSQQLAREEERFWENVLGWRPQQNSGQQFEDAGMGHTSKPCLVFVELCDSRHSLWLSDKPSTA